MEVQTRAPGTVDGESTSLRPKFRSLYRKLGDPASLELHKIYRVVRNEEAAKDRDLQVIDGSGEDYLHPAGGAASGLQ